MIHKIPRLKEILKYHRERIEKEELAEKQYQEEYQKLWNEFKKGKKLNSLNYSGIRMRKRFYLKAIEFDINTGRITGNCTPAFINELRFTNQDIDIQDAKEFIHKLTLQIINDKKEENEKQMQYEKNKREILGSN